MNMRDIARRAGVSSATVSRVVNGSSLVRKDTAEKIQKILDEVDFIPHPAATTLKYGRSKTYGVVIPDIRNPFYSEFLGCFEEILAETDHELLLTSVQSDEQLVRSVRRMLMRQVDAVLLMASEFDTRSIDPLFLHKVPLVTVDRRSVTEGCSDVAVDFEQGFLQAVEHLKNLGHIRIAFIGGTKGLRTSTIRLKSFQRAMRDCGLEFDYTLVRTGDYRVLGGETAALSLMSEPDCPTAIMTVNDLTAFGAIRGLHSMGFKVPHDVSVIGVDDVLLSDILQPPLTTIRIPRKRFAQACIRAINHTKEDVEAPGIQLGVPSELIVRSSTAKLNQGKRAAPATRSKRAKTV